MPRGRPEGGWGLVWFGLCLSATVASEPVPFSDFKPAAARDYLQAVIGQVQTQATAGVEVNAVLARVSSQMGDTEQAEKLARRVLELDPARADTQVFLAGLLIHEDRMQEAARLLRSAVDAKPDVQGGYRQLGMVLDRLGDRKAARQALDKAVIETPDDATARLALGRLLLDEGETREAANQLESACRLDPQLGGAFYALSQARSRLGDADGAQAAMKTFQQLKRKERVEDDAWHINYDDEQTTRALAAGIHAEAAGLFLRQGRPDLAEAHLRQAMRIAPAEVRPRELLATLLLREGRLTEAREVYQGLVTLQPEQALYRLNLGTVFLQLKDYPAAVSELKRALELEPRQVDALNNLARLYLGVGHDLPEALALSRRLAEIQPNAASQDLLGWALFANGQTNAARVAAGRAVELDPTNAVYRERYQRLQSLR